MTEETQNQTNLRPHQKPGISWEEALYVAMNMPFGTEPVSDIFIPRKEVKA